MSSITSPIAAPFACLFRHCGGDKPPIGGFGFGFGLLSSTRPRTEHHPVHAAGRSCGRKDTRAHVSVTERAPLEPLQLDPARTDRAISISLPLRREACGARAKRRRERSCRGGEPPPPASPPSRPLPRRSPASSPGPRRAPRRCLRLREPSSGPSPSPPPPRPRRPVRPPPPPPPRGRGPRYHRSLISGTPSFC
jgi:hypothetical protein